MTSNSTSINRPETSKKIKEQLSEDFYNYLETGNKSAHELVGSANLLDKAYELMCLIDIMRRLKESDNKLKFSLSKGHSAKFRGKGGKIDRQIWPFIRVKDGSADVGELWVDIEFLATSSLKTNGNFKGWPYGRCHELDILLVAPGTNGHPKPNQIFLGVEAKHCPYSKRLLKELLGVRREMAMRTSLRNPNAHQYSWAWSKNAVSNPPSILISYCSHTNIAKYSQPQEYWGIRMLHLPIQPKNKLSFYR